MVVNSGSSGVPACSASAQGGDRARSQRGDAVFAALAVAGDVRAGAEADIPAGQGGSVRLARRRAMSRSGEERLVYDRPNTSPTIARRPDIFDALCPGSKNLAGLALKVFRQSGPQK
jgi:hypothetical protein